MAKVVQVPYQFDISLPIQVAQSVQANQENPITLEALGLLVNLLSYPNSWELHKTELYKRFGKNKKTSVMNAWKELENANYIYWIKYRNGKKDEYVYYLRKFPFSTEEKAQIQEESQKLYGKIWGADFGHPKMDIPKSAGNQKTLLNKNPLLNNINNNIDYIDDDKRKDFAHNEEKFNQLISLLRQATKDEINNRSFNTVVKKVVDKYIQGAIGEGKFRDYLVTSLLNKINELAERREKDESKKKELELKAVARAKRIEQIEKAWSGEQDPRLNNVPIYNWLE